MSVILGIFKNLRVFLFLLFRVKFVRIIKKRSPSKASSYGSHLMTLPIETLSYYLLIQTVH
jgi:hypothetical protein